MPSVTSNPIAAFTQFLSKHRIYKGHVNLLVNKTRWVGPDNIYCIIISYENDDIAYEIEYDPRLDTVYRVK